MLKRLSIELKCDISRVVCLIYNTENKDCVNRICNDVAALDTAVVEKTYADILKEFASRHTDFYKILDKALQKIKQHIPSKLHLNPTQQSLVASYFLMEYSVESAALFNPSLVIHPLQDLENGTKVLMSLRSAGEGHISSIEFVEGVIDQKGNLNLKDRKRSCRLPEVSAVDIEKSVICFDEDVEINEQVIFPLTDDESNGIEDVRFVNFEDDDGKTSYYGTFTAYDGNNIKSKLICTDDFKKYTIRSMAGKAIKDKGMALFPRKINNKYAMISRQDGENIRLMYSDDILTWDHSEIIQKPEFPWQYSKIGNCGSPIELEEGWLLLIHGVGAVRKYVIGAYLLDKEDPSKILKRTCQPMLQAEGKEREGYVPNVVYSCGGICHKNTLYIPFAISDYASGVSTVSVNDLLNMMEE